MSAIEPNALLLLHSVLSFPFREGHLLLIQFTVQLVL